MCWACAVCIRSTFNKVNRSLQDMVELHDHSPVAEKLHVPTADFKDAFQKLAVAPR